MATINTVSGYPLLERGKPPALIVSITTDKGRFSARAPLYVGDVVGMRAWENVNKNN